MIMAQRLYRDEHVPSAITEGLQLRGLDVLTAQEDGRRGASDPVLLDRATELGRLFFTFDADFLKEAALRQRNQQVFPGILYSRSTSTTIRKCIDDLEMIALLSEPEESASRIYYLPM
jgi:predicted nuclease of predicted toxin-antitoxin system